MICRVLLLVIKIVITRGPLTIRVLASTTPDNLRSGLNAEGNGGREGGGVLENPAKSSGTDGCLCEGGCYREKHKPFLSRCCRDICESTELKGNSLKCNQQCPCYHLEKRLQAEKHRPRVEDEDGKRGNCGKKLYQCEEREKLATDLKFIVGQLKKELKRTKANLGITTKVLIGLLYIIVLTSIGFCCHQKWSAGAACTECRARARTHASKNNRATVSASDVITSRKIQTTLSTLVEMTNEPRTFPQGNSRSLPMTVSRSPSPTRAFPRNAPVHASLRNPNPATARGSNYGGVDANLAEAPWRPRLLSRPLQLHASRCNTEPLQLHASRCNTEPLQLHASRCNTEPAQLLDAQALEDEAGQALGSGSRNYPKRRHSFIYA